MRTSITKNFLDKIHGNVFVSDSFHETTNNSKLQRKTAHKIPQSWIKVNFKTYQRLPKISLKGLSLPDSILASIMTKRRSVRQFSGKHITKKELHYLLFQSSGLTYPNKLLDQSRRPYPSAGARYPLEIYPLVLHCNNVEKGLYHYNVKEDSLELLLKGNHSKWLTKITGEQTWVSKSAVVFIITAVLDRTRIKYEDRGYRYVLLEAGHLGQNISLLTTELKMGSCALGGYIDSEVNKLLDIQLQKEVAIYVIAVGKI